MYSRTGAEACSGGHVCRHDVNLAPSRRSAFMVTSTVAPVSARMAGQRPVTPMMVVTRNTAFSPSATVMFWRILPIVWRDRLTMLTTSITRPCRTAASAVSKATSVPPPMAIPTSAVGESRRVVDAVTDLRHDLAPRLELAHDALFVLGQELGSGFNAEVFSDRSGGAAVVARHHDGIDAGALEGGDAGFRVGARLVAHSDDAGDVLTGDQHGHGFSLVVKGGDAGAQVVRERHALRRGLGDPRNRSRPKALPVTPLPLTAARSFPGRIMAPAIVALSRMALARGWLDPASRAADICRTSTWLPLPTGITSVTCGLPSVRVPVLSKAAMVILPKVSRTAPPLRSNPRRAPAERPAAIAAGVEMTRAHGQPIKRIARPL